MVVVHSLLLLIVVVSLAMRWLGVIVVVFLYVLAFRFGGRSTPRTHTRKQAKQSCQSTVSGTQYTNASRRPRRPSYTFGCLLFEKRWWGSQVMSNSNFVFGRLSRWQTHLLTAAWLVAGPLTYLPAVFSSSPFENHSPAMYPH